jgi:peptide-methionine (S)-S-oxide reductase
VRVADPHAVFSKLKHVTALREVTAGRVISARPIRAESLICTYLGESVVCPWRLRRPMHAPESVTGFPVIGGSQWQAELEVRGDRGARGRYGLAAETEKMDALENIGFGGGCHWCTEGIFQLLAGVAEVEQGFIRSDPPSDTWAEGVIVRFNSSAISLPTLIEVHLRTHRATTPYIARSKYRSAIYIEGDDTWNRATDAISSLQHEFDERIQTKVLALRDFRRSDERFRDYYGRDPQRPFCRRYIDPKLDIIRRRFAPMIMLPGRCLKA